MPDPLPPALAALLKQPPVFEHFRTHTIVATLRAVAIMWDDSESIAGEDSQYSRYLRACANQIENMGMDFDE